jgi:hypothetical protein
MVLWIQHTLHLSKLFDLLSLSHDCQYAVVGDLAN